MLTTESCIEAEGYLVVEMPSREEFVEVRGVWYPLRACYHPSWNASEPGSISGSPGSAPTLCSRNDRPPIDVY